jgi:hypothetical protein
MATDPSPIELLNRRRHDNLEPLRLNMTVQQAIGRHKVSAYATASLAQQAKVYVCVRDAMV